MTGGRPTAPVVTRKRRIPVIWVIPALAVAIGIWLAWDTLSKEGPTITISFRAAAGLKAGESNLKFKDINIGTVSALRFSADHQRILVTVGTTAEMRDLLTDDSQFFIVKPELFAGSLRGIGTLLSGPFIEMVPGTSSQHDQHDFIGLEDPPVLEADTPGTTFLVKADRLGSLSVGSPVFFRDMSVGQVLGWDLGNMAENAMLHVFVRRPFDTYVNDSSRFWNASGIKIDLGGTGVSIEVASLKALLLGGIGFETPDPKAPPAVAADAFPLYNDHEAANAASYKRKIQCVAYFDGSVRGVAAGNEVTLRGLKVGHITGVSLKYDVARDAVVAPVTFDVEPERVVGVGRQVFTDRTQAVDALVAKGLRASLSSSNILTGQMLISLDFVKDAPVVKPALQDGYYVIPTTGGAGLSGLQASVGALLDKINTIPFDQIGASLNRTMSGLANVTDGPELKQSLTALTATLFSTRSLMHNFDTEGSPAFKHLPEIAANLQSTMLNANRLVLSLNEGYGDNTKFSRDLGRMMVELNDAVRSFRALADLLTRHPEALVRGRDNKGTE
jgi:paraquat-inducible protein B